MGDAKRGISNYTPEELEFIRAVGQRFRSRRQRAGLSQEQLAKIIGTNNAHISRFERALGLLDVAKFAKACIVFGCSADSVLGLDQIKGGQDVKSGSN